MKLQPSVGAVVYVFRPRQRSGSTHTFMSTTIIERTLQAHAALFSLNQILHAVQSCDSSCAYTRPCCENVRPRIRATTPPWAFPRSQISSAGERSAWQKRQTTSSAHRAALCWSNTSCCQPAMQANDKAGTNVSAIAYLGLSGAHESRCAEQHFCKNTPTSATTKTVAQARVRQR